MTAAGQPYNSPWSASFPSGAPPEMGRLISLDMWENDKAFHVGIAVHSDVPDIVLHAMGEAAAAQLNRIQWRG